MERGYNFNAGPSMLPESILINIREELLDWQQSGQSVLEVSHRSEAFLALMQSAEADLRDLLQIPEDYVVLFLGSPARAQFSAIPMNLLSEGEKAAYLISGHWSLSAYQEAQHFGDVYKIASSEDRQFTENPIIAPSAFKEKTTYLYYTPNETINGCRFADIPESDGRLLIADMTSCLLTEPLDVKKYALIFAGAQKNIAPAGLTLVIMRRDLLVRSNHAILPAVMNYQHQAAQHSLHATPPVFNIYVAAKMFRWLKSQGGVAAMAHLHQKQSSLLYQYIDQSPHFYCPVNKNSRSRVNICFYLKQAQFTEALLQFAEQRQLYNLKGHRVNGGFRASLYNAMPFIAVKKLIECLHAFSEEYLA